MSTSGLLELHGDSGTSFYLPSRASGLATAEVDSYTNSVEPPISVIRRPSGTQGLADLNLHFGRLDMKRWQEKFLAAEAQPDLHPIPAAANSALRDVRRHEGYFG